MPGNIRRTKPTFREAQEAVQEVRLNKLKKELYNQRKEVLVSHGVLQRYYGQDDDDESVFTPSESSEAYESKLHTEMWNALWRIARWNLHPSQEDSVVENILQMESNFNKDMLNSIDMQHPLICLQDGGVRRFGRWMFDHRRFLEGIRKIDLVGNKSSGDALASVAAVIPRTTVEVDIVGNTGPNWIKGVVAFAVELRKRGGGYISCGKGYEREIKQLTDLLATVSQKGGQVNIHILCYTSDPVSYVMPPADSIVRHVYAEPQWDSRWLH